MSGIDEKLQARMDVIARGELGDASALLDAVSRKPEGAGPALLLRATIATLDDSLAVPPTLEEAQSVGADEELFGRICTLQERRSFAALDVRGMEAWRDARPSPTSERGAVEARLCELRRAVLRREAIPGELGDSLGRAATAAGAPDAVIELAALRALAALSEGDLDAALSLARRASRMSRTEGLLAQEYLANIVLARMRRYSGRPHLASRILSALTLVCPRGWRGWLAWELAMVGRAASARRVMKLAVGGDPATVAATTLLSALEAADDGDASVFGEHARRLSAIARDVGLLAVDARALLSALDAEEGVSRWRTDVDASPPPTLSGLTNPPGKGTSHGSEVWVVWDAERGARRMLRSAAALTDEHFGKVQPKHDRAHAAAATLALAGTDGLELAHFYRLVFGGVYDTVLHDGMVRTTVYRARKELDGCAEIERSGGRIVLKPTAPFAIPDPSVFAPTEDQLLRILAAEGGRATAKELAEVMGVSVRSVQDALKVLIEEGACDQVRSGRRIEYVLEDTTFGEPTLHRLTPRSDA